VFSGKLKNMEFNQTLERANAAIAEITRTLESLKTSMKGIDKTVSTFNTTLSGVNETIANINKGQGTLGALMTDRKLYDDIAITVADLQLLAQDIRLHPERYRTILSGKKKPYTVTPDPAKPNYIETPGGK
jgi:phospholipid/cholesterol/gamma-HCH transport system substrate-binding protein